MNITDLYLRRPVFAWMLMFATIMFGLIALGIVPGATSIGVAQFPDVNNPTVTVSVSWPDVRSQSSSCVGCSQARSRKIRSGTPSSKIGSCAGKRAGYFKVDSLIGKSVLEMASAATREEEHGSYTRGSKMSQLHGDRRVPVPRIVELLSHRAYKTWRWR